ncbi:MAG: type II toxin-antitoxin system VapC family toxin [Flavobacteriales bacterium]|nr:type II toxin-antitoxin system VapC family toxin [Flavobacteriales bacterium]
MLDDKQFYISFISQLELLGYLEITKAEQKQVADFLNLCTVIDINNRIKAETVNIRRKYKVKLPDAIIIASAYYLDVPVITADAGFKKVEEIDLLYYQR